MSALVICPVVYVIYVRVVFCNPKEVGLFSFDDVLNRATNWVPIELRLATTKVVLTHPAKLRLSLISWNINT